jgi:uncharacterized protein (DUF3084 family)
MEKMEATLRGQIKEMEKRVTDAKAIKELEKKPQGSEVHWKHVEATLHGQIKIPGHKLTEKEIDNENLEAILHGRIEQLEKQLQKKVAKNKQLETALQKKDRDFATLEFKLWELLECIQERDSENKKLESSLHDEREYYDMHLLSNEKNQATLYSI